MANKYLHASGGTGNWSDGTGTWRTTDQGATITTAPTSADVAIMTANAGNRTLTVDVNSACSALNATGFTGTVSGSAPLVISGNFIFPGTATWSFTGDLTLGVGGTSGTWTWSGGLVHNGNFFEAGTGGKTQVGDLTVTGLYTVSATHTHTGSAYFVKAQGGFTGTNGYWNSTVCPTLYLQGGSITGYVGGAGGTIYLDGNNTFDESSLASRTVTLRGITLEYLSGTSTSNGIVFIEGSPTIKTGSNLPFNRIYLSGTQTITLTSPITANWIQLTNNSATFNGDSVSIAEHLTMYGSSTLSGTSTIIMAGTGIFNNPESFVGATQPGTSTFKINVVINTSGDVTCYPGIIYFGGGKSLIVTAGNFVTTGVDINITTSGYSFTALGTFYAQSLTNDLSNTTVTFNSDLSVDTITLDSSAILTANSNITTSNLVMSNNSTLQSDNTHTITINSSFIQDGTNTSSPIIKTSRVSLTDFVSNLPTTMLIRDSFEASSSYKTLTSGSFDTFQSEFTVAFTYTRRSLWPGISVISGTSTFVAYTGPSDRLQIVMRLESGSNAVCYEMDSAGSKLPLDTPVRIVLTKKYGKHLKIWIGGIQRALFSYSTPLTASANFRTASYLVSGEFVVLSSLVDQTWVNTDYSKYLIKEKYTAAEPNIIFGWHIDDFTNEVTHMKLNYTGTLNNCILYRSNFYWVNASQSTVPIFTYYGSQSDSINVYSITQQNIGGHGVSTTHY